MTPAQVEDHFAAARKRRRIDRNTMMETSYLGANAVANFKKPMKLEELLLPVDEKPRAKQTPEQRLAAAGAWAAAMSRN